MFTDMNVDLAVVEPVHKSLILARSDMATATETAASCSPPAPKSLSYYFGHYRNLSVVEYPIITSDNIIILISKAMVTLMKAFVWTFGNAENYS